MNLKYTWQTKLMMITYNYTFITLTPPKKCGGTFAAVVQTKT